MNSIIMLSRNHYSDKYSSVDDLFRGEFNIYQLLDMFPETYLFLVNDDTEYNNSNVITRKKLRTLFKINRNNNMPCTKCGARMSIVAMYCGKCGYENKYHSIVQYLDPEFTKAAEIKNYVLYGFWQDMTYRDV